MSPEERQLITGLFDRINQAASAPREPEDRPDYRGARTHGDFVATLPLDAEALLADRLGQVVLAGLDGLDLRKKLHFHVLQREYLNY